MLLRASCTHFEIVDAGLAISPRCLDARARILCERSPSALAQWKPLAGPGAVRSELGLGRVCHCGQSIGGAFGLFGAVGASTFCFRTDGSVALTFPAGLYLHTQCVP